MDIRRKSELMYEMIYLKVWVHGLGIHSRAARELGIQAEKLTRLCWIWHELDYPVDSLKRAKRMLAKNDAKIGPQYRKVLSLLERAVQDGARSDGTGVLTRSQVRERVYGTGGLVPTAKAYAKERAVK